MNKAISVISICLAAAVVVLALALVTGTRAADKPPVFNSSYQAVLLDDGQVYYGKLSGLGTPFPEMTEVYYIVNQQDPKTKAVKHILVKRGKELHQPTETFLNARHIVMIEPVGPDSEVAKLILESGEKSAQGPSHK